MIESCSKNRMLTGIIILGGVTVIVLIIESHWTENSSNPSLSTAISNSTNPDHCWLRESYEVLEECHPCKDFEITSRSVEACIPTNFKEVLRCSKSGKTQRSCDKVAWIHERNYWIFEGCMFVLAVVSTAAVFLRQNILDRRVMQRIQKQLANGLYN